jgi:hypothetical protein
MVLSAVVNQPLWVWFPDRPEPSTHTARESAHTRRNIAMEALEILPGLSESFLHTNMFGVKPDRRLLFTIRELNLLRPHQDKVVPQAVFNPLEDCGSVLRIDWHWF